MSLAKLPKVREKMPFRVRSILSSHNHLCELEHLQNVIKPVMWTDIFTKNHHKISLVSWYIYTKSSLKPVMWIGTFAENRHKIIMWIGTLHKIAVKRVMRIYTFTQNCHKISYVVGNLIQIALHGTFHKVY